MNQALECFRESRLGGIAARLAETNTANPDTADEEPDARQRIQINTLGHKILSGMRRGEGQARVTRESVNILPFDV